MEHRILGKILGRIFRPIGLSVLPYPTDCSYLFPSNLVASFFSPPLKLFLLRLAGRGVAVVVAAAAGSGFFHIRLIWNLYRSRWGQWETEVWRGGQNVSDYVSNFGGNTLASSHPLTNRVAQEEWMRRENDRRRRTAWICSLSERSIISQFNVWTVSVSQSVRQSGMTWLFNLLIRMEQSC